MPESWKTIPINAGLLAALITGVAATVLGSYGFQHWVDSRIDDQIDRRLIPVKQELSDIHDRIDDRVSQQVENQRVIINQLDGLDARLTREEEDDD